MSLNETRVEILAADSIRIECPAIFRYAGHRDRFLMRAFEVAEVRSVEIDPLVGSALLRLQPNHGPPSRILRSLSAKVRTARRRPVPTARTVYFEVSRHDNIASYARAPRQASGIRRFVYQGLGSAFLGLSVIGVVSPFVPTTPFILLSGYFFLRSSASIHDRLMQSKLFGEILSDWYLYGGMRRSLKKKVFIIMATVFSASAILTGFTPATLATMTLVSLISITIVLRLPTVADEPRTEVPAAAALAYAG